MPLTPSAAWFIAPLSLLAAPMWGEAKVDWLFNSNMVLQRDSLVPVWGTCDPGEAITVSFAGQSKATTGGKDGRWMVNLDPMPAEATGRRMEIAGSAGALKFENVVVGDVWFCSGQSNMAYSLERSTGGPETIAALDNPDLRLFGAGGFDGTVREPQRRINQHHGWEVCTKDRAKANVSYSAVAFYFAKEVQPLAGVPVGVVGVSLGGSMAEGWIPRAAQAADPLMRDYLTAWEWMDANVKPVPKADPKDPERFQDAQGNVFTAQEYGQRFQDWRHAWDAVKKSGGAVPAGFPPDFRRFMPHMTPRPDSYDRPGVVYDSLLAPFTPLALKGVVWYQGEANAGSRDPRNYEHVMGVLIREWRAAFRKDDLPFLIVQLPNFSRPTAEPVSGNWPILREQQSLMTKSITNVHLAVTIDTFDPEEGDPWHPKNKAPVGRRLALVAGREIYGRDVVAHGPSYRAMAVEGGAIRVSFSDIGGKLSAATPIQTKVPASASPQSQLTGFAVAGADRKWVWADARIDGDSVIVSSPQVPTPVAVRYGWSNAPTCNLANDQGLPAAPFRSDDWPLVEEF